MTFVPNDQKELVDIDQSYNIKEKEKEVEELKQELTNKSKYLLQEITKKPKDFKPDILIATKNGKLSIVQYLIKKEAINVNK